MSACARAYVGMWACRASGAYLNDVRRAYEIETCSGVDAKDKNEIHTHATPTKHAC